MLESPRGLESFLTDAIRQGLLQRASEQVERRLKRVQDEIAKQVSENVNLVIRSLITNNKLQLLLCSTLDGLDKLKNYKYKALLDCYDKFNRETESLESDLNALNEMQLLKMYISKLLEIQSRIYDFKINYESNDACLHASNKFVLKENDTPLAPSNRLTYLKEYYLLSEQIQMISRQLYLSEKTKSDSPSAWLLRHCTLLLKQIHIFAQAELYFTLSRGVKYTLQPELIKAGFLLLEKSGIIKETFSNIVAIKAAETCDVINTKHILNSQNPTTVFMEQFLMFLDLYCCSIRGFHILDQPSCTTEFIDKVTLSLQTTFSILYKRQNFRQGMIETIPNLARMMQSYHENMNDSLKQHLYLVFEHPIKDYLRHVLSTIMPLVNGFFSGTKSTSVLKAIECLPTDHDLNYLANLCLKHLNESQNCGQIEAQVNKIIQTAIQTFANSVSSLSQISADNIQFEFHCKGGFGFAEPTPSHVLGAKLFCITSALELQLDNYRETLSTGYDVVKKWVVNLSQELKCMVSHDLVVGLEASEELSRNICSLFNGLKLYFNSSLFEKKAWEKTCRFLSPLVYHAVFLYVSLSSCYEISDDDKLELVQQTTRIEMAITDLLASPSPKKVAELLLGFKRFLFSEAGEQIDLPPLIIKVIRDKCIDSYEQLFENSYDDAIAKAHWV
ncbi:hypothetical protein BmR1_04g09825 [Babesia microti strain RI]|uniref:Uncharacterized protein n=1 Tax=Babesia microti (strain RI) TaxID=1133968 RepID=I7IHN7_BABMR|nr:hypothetical protein BmR1_04g09825 [Babesia microti strain RI]CCF76132.1 hypothetical protein BmR1_04g09825 [Babesia microti strain RI]|eukprot:XP_012650540.1 hypothetical protein BmR1_04g09825 [Babesia microti strain RI]